MKTRRQPALSALIRLALVLAGLFTATLSSAGPAVWIDSDPACGHDSTDDVDDCWALLLAFRADLNLRGISTVFGNRDGEASFRTAMEVQALYLFRKMRGVGQVFAWAPGNLEEKQMTKIKPAALEIFDEYDTVIRKCRREIISQDWFHGDWWINSNFNANGYTFQLTKTNWFNHNSQGIHIEFWLEENELKEKEFDIVLHFESDVPDRKKLGLLFREAFSPLEGEFEDYRINHQAVCDKLQKRVCFAKSSLPKIVVTEFSRLQRIAPVINDLIRTF